MNNICAVINMLAFLVIIVCGSALDSESTFPLKLTALALAWLLWNMARREGIL